MKKSFFEFMSLCEAVYDKDVAAWGVHNEWKCKTGEWWKVD